MCQNNRFDADLFCHAVDRQTLLLSNPLSGYHKNLNMKRVFNSEENVRVIANSLEYMIPKITNGKDAIVTTFGQQDSDKTEILFGNGYTGIAPIMISKIMKCMGTENCTYKISMASVIEEKAYDLLPESENDEESEIVSVEVTGITIVDYSCFAKHPVETIDECCSYIYTGLKNKCPVTEGDMDENLKKTTVVVLLEIEKNEEEETTINHVIFSDLLSTEYLVTPQNPMVQALNGTLIQDPLIYILKSAFIDNVIKAFICSLRPELESADLTVQSLYVAGLLKSVNEYKPYVLPEEQEYLTTLHDIRSEIYSCFFDHKTLVNFLKEEFMKYPNESIKRAEVDEADRLGREAFEPIITEQIKEELKLKREEDITGYEEEKCKDVQNEYEIIEEKLTRCRDKFNELKLEMEEKISLTKRIQDEIVQLNNEVNSFQKELRRRSQMNSSTVGTAKQSLIRSKVAQK